MAGSLFVFLLFWILLVKVNRSLNTANLDPTDEHVFWVSKLALVANTIKFCGADDGVDSYRCGNCVSFAVSTFSSWKAHQDTQEAQVVQVVHESKVLFGKVYGIFNL